MSQELKKSELLKDKVVDLVKRFVNTEGGITQYDLKILFGERPHQEVATALAEVPIKFD